MALNSAGVEIKEIDLTTVVPGASPSIAGYAGRFNWGPIGVPTLVATEDEMATVFGKPKNSFSADLAEANSQSVSFLTAASYLAYANGLVLSRVANINDAVEDNNAINAVSTLTVGDVASPLLIKNVSDYTTKDELTGLGANFVIAKYAGEMGNSIGVSAVFTEEQYSSSEILPLEAFSLDKATKVLSIDSGSTEDLTDYFNVGDVVKFTFAGVEYSNTVVAVNTLSLELNSIGAQFPNFLASVQSGVVTDVKKEWQYAAAFNGAPATDEFHVVVYDATGDISGEAGTVLEAFPFLSVNFDAKNVDGTSAFYKTVINDTSAYIWTGGVDLSSAFLSTSTLSYNEQLSGGRNGSDPGIDDYLDAYAVFNDTEVDVSALIAPPAMNSISNATVPTALIQNIAEVRKDLVVYLSPRYSDVVNKPKLELANVLAYRAILPSSSYAFMDSGWKSMYDKYNNVFRWVPLCGDTAGTGARTDAEAESWYSHAGYTRGIIKNVVRLAWNPTEVVKRDALYQKGVNPVVTFNGTGTVLFGDKTMLSRPSAFDRINVRKLFIVLEKSIANAAKFSLFEFNDEFTRNRFVSIVEPFLRNVKGRRGLTDYKVVCDSTNNTAQVIDTNRFIGDIYLKPARSINFITLNFVNTPTGVSFEEIVGKF